MLIVIGKILLFFVAFLDGLYLGVLLHELGHGLLAAIFTRQTIVVQVGTSEKNLSWSLGRLRLKLGLKGFRYGFTYYDRASETRGRQILIALGGPLASLVVTLLCAWWILDTYVDTWLWVVGFAFFVANFRILIVSLWPIEYRPFPGKDEVWLSDALDIWRMLFGSKPRDAGQSE